MGRPTMLTPELQAEIVKRVSGGNYAEAAGQEAGLGKGTVSGWITRARAELARRARPGQRARSSEQPFVEFYEAITRARAKAEVDNVDGLQQAAQGGVVIEERTITHPDGRVEHYVRRTPPDWRARAWWLQHSAAGERWNRREQIELTGAGGEPLTIEHRVGAILERLGEARQSPELRALPGGAGELESGE